MEREKIILHSLKEAERKPKAKHSQSRYEQRDLKRGTMPSALDFHIGEKDEFKVLTKLRHIMSNT